MTDEHAIFLIIAELRRARAKHPVYTDLIHRASVVAEEAGELVRASLLHVYEAGPMEDCDQEAIETAATAIRFLTKR